MSYRTYLGALEKRKIPCAFQESDYYSWIIQLLGISPFIQYSVLRQVQRIFQIELSI